MVSLQEYNKVFSTTVPNAIVEKMKLKKGEQLAFIADSETEGRFKVIR